MEIVSYVPKPRLIVGVILTLALLAFVLRAAGGNEYAQKASYWLGLSV